MQTCDLCKKTYQGANSFSKISERDKHGKQTGRIYTVCWKCEKEFYQREIKELATRMNSVGRKFVATNFNGDLAAFREAIAKNIKDKRSKLYD